MYDIHCTTYSVRHTVYYIYCTTYTVIPTLYDIQCIIYTVRHTMYEPGRVYCRCMSYLSYNVQCTLYIIHCTYTYTVRRTVYVLVHGVKCTIYTEQRTLYMSCTVRCKVKYMLRHKYFAIYMVYLTPYIIHKCTLYSVHFILYIIQCTLLYLIYRRNSIVD